MSHPTEQIVQSVYHALRCEVENVGCLVVIGDYEPITNHSPVMQILQGDEVIIERGLNTYWVDLELTLLIRSPASDYDYVSSLVNEIVQNARNIMLKRDTYPIFCQPPKKEQLEQLEYSEDSELLKLSASHKFNVVYRRLIKLEVT